MQIHLYLAGVKLEIKEKKMWEGLMCHRHCGTCINVHCSFQAYVIAQDSSLLGCDTVTSRVAPVFEGLYCPHLRGRASYLVCSTVKVDAL